MRITCPFTFKGQPEGDRGATIWSFIANAEKLCCVIDGDAIQVAAITGRSETPLVDVGIGLWRQRGALGEVLAQHAARSGEQYRSRLNVFASKPIEWLGE